MKNTMRDPVLLATWLMLPAASINAQAPMAKPLAEFEKLVAQLTSGAVVGEPMRAGHTVVVPFASIQFGVGGAGATIAFGGGLSARVVPLGVLLVEGDDVRAEPIPEQDGKASLGREILQAMLDRKIVFMGNGLNLGRAQGSIEDLAPLVSGMLGQTTLIGNGLNLGSWTAPAPAASPKPGRTMSELKKLFEAKEYADALSVVEALLAKDPGSVELQAWKARILDNMSPPESPSNPR